ncbi:MAG: DotU family type IV/VI secretion system protein [candidate division Zixibacteria bacterium]|nr:DotU family type IV/VI secretion system protein [candidate division Zixibacteria bacterium]
MYRKEWEAVHKVFNQFEEACKDISSFMQPENTLIDPGALIDQTQDKLLELIRFLKMSLQKIIPAEEARLVRMVIVFYFDEQIRTRYFANEPIVWPLMQKKAYQSTTGGEKFYQLIDNALRSEETDRFLYEICYFCLKCGFRGKYFEQEEMIKHYMQLLDQRINADLTTH